MPIPDVSGWLHDVRDVPADYRRAGLPERRVGVTPSEHVAPSPANRRPTGGFGFSAPPVERVTPLSKTYFVVGSVDGEALDWWQFDTEEDALRFMLSGDYELVQFFHDGIGWSPLTPLHGAEGPPALERTE